MSKTDVHRWVISEVFFVHPKVCLPPAEDYFPRAAIWYGITIATLECGHQTKWMGVRWNKNPVHCDVCSSRPSPPSQLEAPPCSII